MRGETRSTAAPCERRRRAVRNIRTSFGSGAAALGALLLAVAPSAAGPVATAATARAGAAPGRSPAAHVAPLPSASFGGGSDPSRTENAVALVALRTNASGSRFTLWVDVENFNCRSDSEALFVVPSVPIAAAGGFSLTGSFTSVAAASASSVRARISGSFLRPYLARGEIEVTNGDCATASLTFFAGDPAAGRGSGARRAGMIYVGYFSQRSVRAAVNLPFVLRLSTPGVASSGKALAGAAARVNLLGRAASTCSHLEHFDQIWFDHPIAAASFSDSEHFSIPMARSQSAATSIAWSGTFGASVLRGTWQERSEVRSPARTVVASCTTGALTWSAIGVAP